MPRSILQLMLVIASSLLTAAGCGVPLQVSGHGAIAAVGAENQYADVIAQIGGRYVTVTAIVDNPASDPHTFEASPAVAAAIAGARLVVENGLGYDTFMNRLEAAAPASRRQVIDVQRLLGLPGSTSDPHLWYRPDTMPALADALATALSRIEPNHTAYFRANAVRFDRSLRPWLHALAALRSRYSGVRVAVTEPVADYMLNAAGARISTPFALQADLMNGLDPAPQTISRQRELIDHRLVEALVYNRQVSDSLAQSFLAAARARHIPVVGVSETMPAHGYDYQRWMLAETDALRRAVAGRKPAEAL